MLVETYGGYEDVRSDNEEKINIEGTHYSLYRPTLKKNSRVKYLSYLSDVLSSASDLYLWRFEPSLVSIKEAMLNQS
jgi:hypothetical protein